MTDWKKPIPRNDYSEIVAEPIAIEKGKSHLWETKDSSSPTGQRLRAKVRMTFSGLMTKNRAVYLPNQMFDGAKTFVTPYPKPILTAHNDMGDPLGRIIDVRYVSTINEAAMIDKRVPEAMAAFRGKKKDPIKWMSAVPLFIEMSQNADSTGYMGVGHIIGLWDIVDPDTIQKVLDKRFLTVSTNFNPQGAWCSACGANGELTDWRHQDCEHSRGQIIDGTPVVAVPFGFEYEEASFVSIPAAVHAQVLEVGGDLSFSDAIASRPRILPRTIFEDLVIGNDAKAFRISDGTQTTLPTSLVERPDWLKLDFLLKNSLEKSTLIDESTLSDSEFLGPNRLFPVPNQNYLNAARRLLESQSSEETKATLLPLIDGRLSVFNQKTTSNNTDEVIAETNTTKKSEPQGNPMNLSELLKDSEASYEALAKHLHQDAARLTSSLLKDLDDSLFVGPDRTLPVKDAAHLAAIKSLLDAHESSPLKEEILAALATFESAFAAEQDDKSEPAPANVDAASSDPIPEPPKEEAPSEPAPEMVTLPKAELDSLRAELEKAKAEVASSKEEALKVADKVSELEQARQVQKVSSASLLSERDSLRATNTSLVKEVRELLAEQVLDLNISLGLKVEDRASKLTELTGRTLESLKDSVNDLRARAKSGLARQPELSPVPPPGVESEKDSVVEKKRYSAIIDRYYELYYGPDGESRANKFLVEQKRAGNIPAHINP